MATETALSPEPGILRADPPPMALRPIQPQVTDSTDDAASDASFDV